MISADSQNYEALRLRSEIELERHHFKQVAEYSRQLMNISPNDPWNWGTLGDALVEMGDYDGAAEAYQKMVSLRPGSGQLQSRGMVPFPLRRYGGSHRRHEEKRSAQAVRRRRIRRGAWWSWGSCI